MTAHPTNPDFTTASFERHVIRPDVNGNLADLCGYCTLLPTVSGFVRATQTHCTMHAASPVPARHQLSEGAA